MTRAAGATVCVLSTLLLCTLGCGGDKKVPDVVGLSFADAEKALKSAGLSAKADGSQEAKVKSQDPPSGAPAPKDGAVSLVLETEAASGGAGVPVPDLTGKTAAEAKTLLEGAGFQLGAVTTRVVARPANEIVDQSPKPNNPIAPGQAVAVVVADENLVQLPELNGKNEVEAKQALLGLIEIEKVEKACRPGTEPVNTVYESIPRGGDSTSRSSKVVIRIKDDCVEVPDVRELEKGVAFAKLNSLGLLGNPSGTRRVPEKKDRIADQSPAPHQLAARGSQVNLVIYTDLIVHRRVRVPITLSK
jgi:beta-lactam-binding protein with PASTA domain